MKKILTLFCAACWALSVFAQKIEVTATSRNYDDKSRPCLSVAVEADKKELASAWETYWKDNYKIKFKGNSPMIAEEVEAITISDKRFILISEVEQRGTSANLYVMVSFGYDVYAGPGAETATYEKMKLLVRDFVYAFYMEKYTDLIEDTQKNLDKENNTLSKCENDVVNLEENIRKWEESIANAKQEIIDTKKKIEQTKLSIADLGKELEKWQQKKAAVQ